MSCSSWEGNLTRKVSALNGVIEASFSVLTKQAKVVIDINKISIREIIDTITFGKFTANLKEKNNKTDIRDVIRIESIKQRKKLLLSLMLWIPILVLIWLFPYISPLNKFLTFASQPNGPTLYVYITGILSLMLQYYLGRPLYISAWNALKNLSSNMDTLVVIGTTASILYGIVQFFIGYPEFDLIMDEHHRMKVHEHAHSFEVSSTILFIICVGKYLEAYAKSKTVQKLSDLASIKVTKATLFTPNNQKDIDFNGEERIIQVELLNKGDLIKVINGQVIPTDGTVVFGHGFCDESMLTGESAPAKKEVKSKVYGGTLLHKGSLIIRVDAIEEESSLNQILKLVENAQTSKAPIQSYADRISSYFVPIIIMCACVSWIIWFIAVYTSAVYFADITESKFSFAFTFGISTVVIACPCALGLATPTAVMVWSGVAASLGILIKGGSILESTSKTTAIVFDKTGTLTEGTPEVTDVEIWEEVKEEKEIYFIAATCEGESEHPIGKMISSSLYSKIDDNSLQELQKKYTLLEFENINGEGIICKFKNNQTPMDSDEDEGTFRVLIGNEKLMQKYETGIGSHTYDKIQAFEEQGKTVIQVAINNEIVMIIALQEKHIWRPEAKNVCNYLRRKGFEIHMITGDQKHSAIKIANFLEIPHKNVVYRAYPEDKKQRVQLLQKHHRVMFVGDGVNDSPVLAQSDIGVAINSKSDITVEAADIVIINDNLNSIIDALRLTSMSFKRIKINFFWAFIYNIILIPIAMGILYPIIGFRLSPSLAALAMALSSISVVMSSLMIKLYKPFKA